MTNAETWGEPGPAMKKLNQRQQDFVRALVLEKPGYGGLVNAYRKAGYGRTDSKRSTLSKDGHHLSRDPRIIEAVAEESKKVLRLGHPAAVNEALALVMDVSHKDHARAVSPYSTELIRPPRSIRSTFCTVSKTLTASRAHAAKIAK